MSITCGLNNLNTFKFSDKADLSLLKDPIKSMYKNKAKHKGIDFVLEVVENLTTSEFPLSLINGNTGCGKSTFLINQLFKKFKKPVISIQPRIILTQTNAQIVQSNDKSLVFGKNIGYLNSITKIKTTDKVSINYMTTQIYCNQFMNYKNSIICIDEVHIKDLPMFELLKIIKTNLKTIINAGNILLFLSATMDIDFIASYLGINLKNPYSLLFIEGTTNYEVERSYMSNFKHLREVGQYIGEYMIDEIKNNTIKKENNKMYIKNYIDLAYILPKQKMFKDVVNGLVDTFTEYNEKNKQTDNILLDFIVVDNYTKSNVYTNFISTRTLNTMKVLIIEYMSEYVDKIPGKLLTIVSDEFVKIFVSTPAIETGQNIPSLKTIVDSGLIQKRNVQPLSKQAASTDSLKIIPISKATQIQRIGRVGRRFPGKAILLYSKEVENNFVKTDYSENLITVSLLNWYVSKKVTSSNYHNDIVNKYEGKTVKLIEYNNYIIPNSIPTLIRTVHDMIDCALVNVESMTFTDNHVNPTIITQNLLNDMIKHPTRSLYEFLLLASIYSRGETNLYSQRNDVNTTLDEKKLELVTAKDIKRANQLMTYIKNYLGL